MRFADEYGFYELNPFPGCNQIAVSNHAHIFPDYRGEGKGQLQHRQRLQKAKELGYNLLVCTVKSDNKIEKHILEKYGWEKNTSFFNTETENQIEMWTKVL